MTTALTMSRTGRWETASDLRSESPDTVKLFASQKDNKQIQCFQKYWICESCLQLPEDEESVPPILHYNNHMANKDVWVSFELSRQQSAGHGVMPFPHQTHHRGSSCAGVTCAALCVLSEAADPNFWINNIYFACNFC